MSTRTLARRFRASVGVPPAEWLRAERLRLAQRLLETSADPVSLVARRAGYDSPTTMRTQFARRIGTSPRAYRQTFRGPAQAWPAERWSRSRDSPLEPAPPAPRRIGTG